MSELYTVTAEEGRLRFLPRTDAALEQAVLDESPLPGCGFVSRLGDPGLLHCVVFRHERKPGGVFVVEDDNGLLFAAVAETNLAYAVALGRLGKMISYARYGADIFAENMLDDDAELFGGDMLALTEGYYRDVAAMAERKPVILGHIDLVTKLNRGNALFDEEAPRYRAAALEALHHADPDKTLLEINTGAISRGYRDTPYPAAFLLREWRAMGGQVILTADAHSPETVIFGYRQAAALARAAGYRESVLLTGRGWEPCAL